MAIMPTRKNSSPLRGKRVHLRPPRRSDAEGVHRAGARKSSAASRLGAAAGDTRRASPHTSRATARQRPTRAHAGFLVVRNDDDALAGVFNFSEIVRGVFHSAYVGYYAFAPLAGDGYMAEGFALALEFAFGQTEAASRRSERAARQSTARSRSSNARASSAKAIRAAT